MGCMLAIYCQKQYLTSKSQARIIKEMEAGLNKRKSRVN
jgi:hypothetical protein